MDLQLNSRAATEIDTPGGMPPEAPVSMPAQDLSYKSWRTERHLISPEVLYARFILIVVTMGVTTYGIYQMLQVVRFASMTLLQGTMPSPWVGLHFQPGPYWRERPNGAIRRHRRPQAPR
jgi:hypothetical protein